MQESDDPVADAISGATISLVAAGLPMGGFPVALILAWAFELTPEGIKRAEDWLGSPVMCPNLPPSHFSVPLFRGAHATHSGAGTRTRDVARRLARR
jgi:hypothetical protein